MSQLVQAVRRLQFLCNVPSKNGTERMGAQVGMGNNTIFHNIFSGITTTFIGRSLRDAVSINIFQFST
jgi:hypothetical protein